MADKAVNGFCVYFLFHAVEMCTDSETPSLLKAFFAVTYQRLMNSDIYLSG